MKKTLFLLLSCLLGCMSLASAEKVVLSEKGKNSFSIVIPANASPAHKRAAEELAKYTAKISNAPVAKIGTAPVKGLLPVYLEISKEKLPMIDAYRLNVSKNSVRISGQTAQALLHGVYRLLFKYANMRWLVPGEDGEYFVPGTKIAVPIQNKVDSPAFFRRGLELNCANTSGIMKDTWDWILRNNYTLSYYDGAVYANKKWKPELGIALRERGSYVRESKMFCGILTGTRIRKGAGTEKKELDKLFVTNKDFFPLVEGKRIYMKGHEQPCTSNPGVIRMMSEHVLMHAGTLSGKGQASFAVINQDGTTWCKCPSCLALDPASEKKNNYMSTRYWTLLNHIFKGVLEKYPDVIPYGLAYQNFQTVPDGVKIDPRIGVGLSFNRRCFRHNLDDPKCPTNTEFLKYYTAWGKLPNKTYSREELHAGVGSFMMPSARQMVQGFKIYKKVGIDGASICTVPPDGTYRPFYTDVVKQGWFCEWQTLYLAGLALWDQSADTDKYLEEANSLYYGKGWKGGMKEFRTMLDKACREDSGCYGWGHGTPPGRVLAKAGLLEKLEKCLADAEKAAKDDARALAHIKREKYLFNISLVAAAKEFMSSYKELKGFTAPGKIKIDGKAEDAWKKTEIYSSFRKFAPGNIDKEKSSLAKYQTFVRAMYDKENLYLFIEAMEPDPGTVVMKKNKGDAPWGDDAVEIFLTHPNFNGGYYHFAFTRKGALYQAKTTPGSMTADASIKTDIEIASLSMPDRWCAEVRIPAGKIGQTFDDGHTWQINIARNRKNTKGNELSSLTGSFHGAYLPLSLAGSMVTGKTGSKDTRMWLNGNFSDIFVKPNDKWAKNWNLGKKNSLARGWALNVAWKGGSTFEILTHPGTNDNYVHLKNGNFYQRHSGKDKALKYTFRAKGKGLLTIMVFRYQRAKWPKHVGTESILKLKLDSDQWKTYTGTYVKKNADELISLVFWADKTGDFYFDDVYCYGADVPEKK